MSKFYITTPIYYVNGEPHLGHIYTTLAADVITRFKKLDGVDAYFLTGTDENGKKIQEAAKAKGTSEIQHCNEISQIFLSAMNKMNFKFDYFVRTTHSYHTEEVTKIWSKMLDKGYIYQGKYSGWYSVRDEAFYSKDEVIAGKAPTGAPVEWIEEDSYFFKLSAFKDKLLALYEEHPLFIQPSYRKNQVVEFVKSGLRDLSISRSNFSWGIKVPNDEKHVIYVWLDALFSYYTPLLHQGKDAVYWPADVHLIGKDILTFHAVYWPAFLMALDMPLPKQIFAHGWWLVEGEKMSKSVGNVLDPLRLAEEYGVDIVRYFLMRDMPFGNDHSFSHANFVSRCNAELANTIGNLLQRVVSFTNKYANSEIHISKLEPEDEAVLHNAYNAISTIKEHMDNLAIHLAFEEVLNIAKLGNEYIDRMAPWNLKNTDTSRMHQALYTSVELLRIVAILLQPIVPDSASRMLNILNISTNNRSFQNISPSCAIELQHSVNQAEIIFPRIA